jgi:ABC-2 type transport system permease protein
VQLVADASDTNTGATVVNYATSIVLDFQKQLIGDVELPYTIQPEIRMLYNPQLNSSYGFVPGVMTLVIMLLGAMMTSASIVREKEMGNMEVLLVSPLRPLLIIVTKAIPYLALSFINVLVILALGVFALKVPIVGSLPLLLAESLLFIFTSLCLGLLISTVAPTQQVAFFIAGVGLMMPTAIFGGFLFPLENMPLPLRTMANIFPAKWFYIIAQSVMIKGSGFGAIWKETLVLAIMAVVLLAISIRKFKIRLE